MDKKINLFLLTIFFVLFSLSTLALAVDCPIPDTGQTKCYDNTQEITCPDPGQSFYGQDAQYPCNPHFYTKLDENGNDLPDDATEWAMVRDNVTGLIWQKDTAPGTYTWEQALSYCAGLTLAGYDDWRLPTIMELTFLVDRDRHDPTINTTYFPNTVSSYYWSSTPCVYYPYGAWGVRFGDGYVLYGVKSDDGYGRAVRSGQCGSFDNFIDNGDGTVTDTDTGLMWQKDTTPGTYNWQQALSYCENLILNNDGKWTSGNPNASGAKHNDWRLPNVNELHSIVDYSTYGPSINTTFFPNTVSDLYWSSTTDARNPGNAWPVRFYYGGVLDYGKSSHGFYGRAVRSGQCGSFDTSTTTTISGSTTSTISGSTTTTVPPCPTETLYGEYSQQTELLRYLRDNVLSTTPEGQELIKLYYELSTSIVKAMEEDEEFKEQIKEMIDGVVELIKEIEQII